jgi:hypothetical protein
MTRKKNDPDVSMQDHESNRIEVRSKPKYKFPTADKYILCPRSDQQLDMIAHDLLLWAEQDDSITFGGFIEVSGLVNARLYEYAKRHHGLADAIVVARQIIGDRREKRGLENKYNSAIVLGTMPLYDPEVRAYKKEMAQKDTEYGSAKIIVHMDSFPETKDVPVKNQERDEP